MTALKVCMVVKNQLWNDARVKKEALTLSGAGHTVTIISLPEPGAPERETWNGISVVRVPKAGKLKASVRRALDSAERKRGFPRRLRENPLKQSLGNLFHSILYQRRLLREALATRARVFHAHDLDTLAVCAVAAVLLRAKLVYDSHELWLGSTRHLEETGWLFRTLERTAEKLIAPRAHAVISVTPGREKVMKEMYGGLKSWLVPNYPPAISPGVRDPEIRALLGAPSDRCFLFIYQGILCSHRGLEQLIEASSLLGDCPVHIAVVGHDASRGAIKAYAGEKGCAGRITFHPPVPSEELHRYTAAADGGLLLFQGSCPNHVLSLPNKLFEYMMGALPILACDLPEITALVSRHSCGITIDATSPGGIARGMIAMASNTTSARAMGERGREAALRHYTWERSSEALLSVYDSLALRDDPS